MGAQAALQPTITQLQRRCFELDEAAELIEEYGRAGDWAAINAELVAVQTELYRLRQPERTVMVVEVDKAAEVYSTDVADHELLCGCNMCRAAGDVPLGGW